MTNLEQQLLGSRKIREFLKHFSETQWTRVLKASVIMGIQELERTSQVQHLSAQNIADIVGKFFSNPPIFYFILTFFPHFSLFLVKQEESIRLRSKENSQIVSNATKSKANRNDAQTSHDSAKNRS